MFEIVLIKVDDLEKKFKEDYFMIWYGKERKDVLISNWKAHVRNLDRESVMDCWMNEYERKKETLLHIELKNLCLWSKWIYHKQLMFFTQNFTVSIELEMIFNIVFLLFYKLVFIRKKSELVPLLLAIKSHA